MNILLALLQMLFSHLNENLDRIDKLRQRRDLDDPVIIPPVMVPNDEVKSPTEAPTETPEIVQTEFIKVKDEYMDGETPGFATVNRDKTTTTGDLNINLYSEPFCESGFYPLPGLVKDLFLTVSVFCHLIQLIYKIKKAIILRRRRNLAAQNHPINRPILGQQGKNFDFLLFITQIQFSF